MVGISPMKSMLLTTIMLSVLLAIIALAMNERIGATNNTNSMNAAIAFNLFGLFLMMAASVLFLILFFACLGKYRLFMIIVVTLIGGAVLCFSIATGAAYHPYRPDFTAWLLSSVWTSVIACIIALVFLISGSSSI